MSSDRVFPGKFANTGIRELSTVLKFIRHCRLCDISRTWPGLAWPGTWHGMNRVQLAEISHLRTFAANPGL